MCMCKCAWWVVLKWNVFENVACSIRFVLYFSQHQEGLRLHVHGVSGSDSAMFIIFQGHAMPTRGVVLYSMILNCKLS